MLGYFDELNKAIEEDKIKHGKKSLKEEEDKETSPYGRMPKHKKDCDTLSQVRKSVLQFLG